MSLVAVAPTPVIGSPEIMDGNSAPCLVEVLVGHPIIGGTLLLILLAKAFLTHGMLGMVNVMEGLTRA